MLYVQIILPGMFIYSITGKDRDIMAAFSQSFGQIVRDINRPTISKCGIESRIQL